MDSHRPDDGGAIPGLRATTKACDICHTRKIKCDRKTPCSACVSNHMTCTTSPRPPEKRKRVTSAVYEEDARSVNERLASLERTISSFVANQKSNITTTSPSHEPNHRSEKLRVVRSSRPVEDDYHSPFEGASSFMAHSKQASQAFGSVAASPSTTIHESESSSHLAFEVEYSDNETNEPISNLFELPSRSLVLKTLRAAKTNPRRYFDGLTDLNLANLTDMCQRVFFPIEDFSPAFMAVVNVCLWKLFDSFGERDLRQHRIDKQEFEEAKMGCKRTLDTAVRCTPLLLGHSYTQIQAMLLLSSRPSLALTFASACARLCQGAGYHCLKFDSSVPQVNQKIVIFWVVFSLDRVLSLNFGRSPSLQDYDVAASRPSIEEARGDLDLFFCSFGVDLAYLQGDIYRVLYSCRAQSESLDTKAENARILADRTVRLCQQLLLYDANDDAFATRMIEGYGLLLRSHLVSIHQAIPPPRRISSLHFSNECIAASRTTMEGYNAAWEKYGSPDDTAWKSVLSWIYLCSPFTAFIVLFGTVITLKSEADLSLMSASVKTLKQAAQASPGISKLRDACEHFFDLAKSYMAQVLRDENGRPVLGSFDMSSRDWNQLLDEWELGLAGENARENLFLSGMGEFGEVGMS